MEISKELIGLLGTIFGAAIVLAGQYAQTRSQHAFEREQNLRKEMIAKEETERNAEYERKKAIVQTRIQQARQTQIDLKNFNEDTNMQRYGASGKIKLVGILLASGDEDIKPSELDIPKDIYDADWRIYSTEAIEILGRKLTNGDYYKD